MEYKKLKELTIENKDPLEIRYKLFSLREYEQAGSYYKGSSWW